MGLPPEDRSPGGANGDGPYADSNSPLPNDASTLANGQSSAPQQRYASTDPNRSERPLDPNSEVDPRQRRPGKDRRPSGQQRICGKCQRHLTGQFVRALGDTYHLECFTCHVRTF